MEATAVRYVFRIDPARLPAEKRPRWELKPSPWEKYSEDERARWREWFEWSIREGGQFWDAEHRRANLAGVSLAGCDLREIDLAGANLERADLRRCDLTHANLSGADLTRAHLEKAVLNRADLTDAILTTAHLGGADLTGVDFKDARLYGARITEPTWWIDLPRTTMGGGVVFQRGIPDHPIQDVLGLPPLLRRQIADTQHLRDLYQKCSRFGRTVIWGWGVSCGFGQSMGRLCIACMGLFLLFTLLYMSTPFSVVHYDVANQATASELIRPSFWQALYFTMTTFTTPGMSQYVPVATFGRVLVTLQGLGCFLMLGGVLSIFSNKMARLA